MFVVSRLVSRDSALYGGLGSALAGIVVAAELRRAADLLDQHTQKRDRD